MRVMLDTNTVSYVIKGEPPEVRKRLVALPMDSVVISAVTQGELLYGLARRGHPATLTQLVREFLLRVLVLPWDDLVAEAYGELRASCAAAGITLGALDMMIAAHAVAAEATLVSHDRAFTRIPGGVPVVEDWIHGV